MQESLDGVMNQYGPLVSLVIALLISAVVALWFALLKNWKYTRDTMAELIKDSTLAAKSQTESTAYMRGVLETMAKK